MIQFNIFKDPSSQNSYLLPMSDSAYTAKAAASTLTAVAVPAGARLALVAASDFYYVGSSASIRLPTEGEGFVDSGMEFSKEGIVLNGEAYLYFIGRNAFDLGVTFWR